MKTQLVTAVWLLGVTAIIAGVAIWLVRGAPQVRPSEDLDYRKWRFAETRDASPWSVRQGRPSLSVRDVTITTTTPTADTDYPRCTKRTDRPLAK